jgi:hypothetical protein
LLSTGETGLGASLTGGSIGFACGGLTGTLVSYSSSSSESAKSFDTFFGSGGFTSVLGGATGGWGLLSITGTGTGLDSIGLVSD